MNVKNRSIALIVTVLTILSAHSLYACSGCGCSAKKADEAKTPAACCVAAKKAGTDCGACKLKKEAAMKKSSQCKRGGCPLSK